MRYRAFGVDSFALSGIWGREPADRWMTMDGPFTIKIQVNNSKTRQLLTAAQRQMRSLVESALPLKMPQSVDHRTFSKTLRSNLTHPKHS